MVTWGQNTVHTFPNPAAGATGGASAAPAAPPPQFSFGSSTPSPAPGGGFGGTTPSFFGTAPSPTGGGSLFSSTATPSSAAPAGGAGFGSFSSSTFGGGGGAAPSPGLFASSPSGGGLFGAPSGGGLFGQPQQQQQPGPMLLPAQAALQAHLDATARQEEARVTRRMERLFGAYAGTASAPSSTKSAEFTLVYYTAASSQVLQQQWLRQGIIGGGGGAGGAGSSAAQQQVANAMAAAPPRPPQVSEQDWNRAVVNNPDPQHSMPAALVGAEALQARLSYQQQQANECSAQLETIQSAAKVLSRRYGESVKALQKMREVHELQKKRLLDTLKKVELARCMNAPLQGDEVRASEKLRRNANLAEQMHAVATTLLNDCRGLGSASAYRSIGGRAADVRQGYQREREERQAAALKEQLLPVVQKHRDGIAKLVDVTRKDSRDLNLIKQRVSDVRGVAW